MQFKTNIEKLRDNKINFSFNLCITKENQHLKKEMMDYYRTYNPCAINCSYIFDEKFDFSVLYPKKIKPANFFHNLKHNPCIDGKITIYENGNIGTCPLMRNNIIPPRSTHSQIIYRGYYPLGNIRIASCKPSVNLLYEVNNYGKKGIWF